jgi:hypothetical protein
MTKKITKTQTETKQTEKQTTDPMKAWKEELLTGKERPEGITHLQHAAANDPFLGARIAWTEQLNREALSDFPNTLETLNIMSWAYSTDWRRYVDAYMERIGRAVEIDERTEKTIRRLAERLLSNTEYSTGYESNTPGCTIGQVPLTHDEMKERFHGFGFLMARALFGWRPILHWGITDNNPRISWAKI